MAKVPWKLSPSLRRCEPSHLHRDTPQGKPDRKVCHIGFGFIVIQFNLVHPETCWHRMVTSKASSSLQISNVELKGNGISPVLSPLLIPSQLYCTYLFLSCGRWQSVARWRRWHSWQGSRSLPNAMGGSVALVQVTSVAVRWRSKDSRAVRS